MELSAFIAPLAGGMCIGIAASLLMLSIGRIAGISGIAFTAMSSPRVNRWAMSFVVGLFIGAGLFHLFTGAEIPALAVSLPMLLAGGFIVGLGTKLGSGCTSGHGICGLGRMSARSLAAVVIFMTTAIATVFVRLHL